MVTSYENLTTHSTRARDSIPFMIELFHNRMCCMRGPG